MINELENVIYIAVTTHLVGLDFVETESRKLTQTGIAAKLRLGHVIFRAEVVSVGAASGGWRRVKGCVPLPCSTVNGSLHKC